MTSDVPEPGHMNPRFVRGFPMPSVKWFSEQNVEAAMDYMPLDDDIVLCTYPKTGTTWMTYIIWGILHKEENILSLSEAVTERVPFLEFDNCVEIVKKLPRPRLYKHHLPLTRSQWNPRAKYIYVYRHPEDVVASFYHFSKETSGKETSLDTFFEHFLTGNIAYGDYFDHISSFCARRADPNLLMVSYEDLKRDIRAEILRIAKFLGDSYHKDLLDNDARLNKIIETTSFDYMKKNLELNLPTPDGSKRDITLVRKGKVGEGKKILTGEQRTLLRNSAQAKLGNSDLFQRWYENDHE